MANLIPSLGSCVARMTAGERRLAERLQDKLDDDYLLWYDLPVGPARAHPDFLVLHPRRGLLVLEVKDWRLETIVRADRQLWDIAPHGELKRVVNPLEQARHYAHQVADALAADRLLRQAEGRGRGGLCLPWSHGVVFSRIRRAQFERAQLDQAIPADRVICADEMTEAMDAEDFQTHLWAMFDRPMRGVLSLPQIDRIRWLLFPEVRVASQASLWAPQGPASQEPLPEAPAPDLLQVMDLQQEQLARSLGEGHRLIHGVAGSGKTMILGYRAEQLAQGASAGKPVLVLCYNEPLALKLQAQMDAKGLSERVHVRHFHRWCRQQLVAFGQTIPPQGPGLFEALVEGVIRGVERGQIPSGQYLAVLVDEGHDFEPEWLKLVVQMVDPATQSLLVLYDDAQGIYERRLPRRFSFRSVGIQAAGRTTVLRINYRNTRQVLETAREIAAELLQPKEAEADGVPTLMPLTCGREGEAPLRLLGLPHLRAEAVKVAELLAQAHAQGTAWGDMAVLCRDHRVMDVCAAALCQRRLPHQVRRRTGEYRPGLDLIHIMSMHASKGLEFPLVALPGLGLMPEAGADAQAEARLFYVAATRATRRLILTASGQGGFGQRLALGGEGRAGLEAQRCAEPPMERSAERSVERSVER